MSALARQRGTLASASLALFCIQLDFFALTLALPDMARSFSASPESAQWTLSGYMLSLGALFIVAGRVGDIVGRRRAFVFGCVLFTATRSGRRWRRACRRWWRSGWPRAPAPGCCSPSASRWSPTATPSNAGPARWA